MKSIIFLLVLNSMVSFGQDAHEVNKRQPSIKKYVKSVDNLTLEASFELASRASNTASKLGKKVAIAVLDASGTIILLLRNEDVGPHNIEAARRKAYTALSTKTSTLLLMRNASLNNDTQNLNTLPELLLLSGGVPIWYKENIIGSIGIAGGGSPENDNLIAESAVSLEIELSTTK
jgi:uncharacterized protein GlcG (DUF336 family)